MKRMSSIPSQCRWVLLFAVAVLAGGCARCNVLEEHHSPGCNAKLVAAVILVAPAALASAAFEGVHDGVGQRHQRRLILAGDRAVTAKCVWMCDSYNHLDDASALQQRSVERVIEWWGMDSPWEQAPIVMKAYLLRSEASMDSDPAAAERYLRRAAALAADPRMLRALKAKFPDMSSYDLNVYDEMANKVQARLIRFHYRGIPGRAGDPSELSTNCRAVAAWPPAWYQGDTERAERELGYLCRGIQASESQPDDHPVAPVLGRGVIEPENY